MAKKNVTLMVVPDSNGISRQVSLPVYLIWSSVAGVIGLIFASFFLSAQFFSDRVAESELEALRAENIEIQEQYEELRWYISEVENRYDVLVEKETKIRSLFDLPEIPIEERQLGIGGPSSPAFSNLTIAQQTAAVSESSVDRLLKLSEFELNKYSEVENSLEKFQTRLRHTPSIWPTTGWTSRGFGMKHDPFTGMKQFHRGIDVASRMGTPVIATADGRIKMAGKNGGMGKTIVIDHGYGFVSRYAHLSKYEVKRGQRVKRGDVIALMGSTGYSTGPHLHYEVIRNGKSINPFQYILNEK